MVDEGLYKKGASSPPGILLDCNEGSQSCIHSAVIQKCVSASRPILIVPSARAYMAYWLGWHDQKTYRIGKKKKRRRKSGAGGCSRLLTHTMWARTVFVLSIRLLLLVISSLRKKKRETLSWATVKIDIAWRSRFSTQKRALICLGSCCRRRRRKNR